MYGYSALVGLCWSFLFQKIICASELLIRSKKWKASYIGVEDDSGSVDNDVDYFSGVGDFWDFGANNASKHLNINISNFAITYITPSPTSVTNIDVADNLWPSHRRARTSNQQ